MNRYSKESDVGMWDSGPVPREALTPGSMVIGGVTEYPGRLAQEAKYARIVELEREVAALKLKLDDAWTALDAVLGRP